MCTQQQLVHNVPGLLPGRYPHSLILPLPSLLNPPTTPTTHPRVSFTHIPLQPSSFLDLSLFKHPPLSLSTLTSGMS